MQVNKVSINNDEVTSKISVDCTESLAGPYKTGGRHKW